MINWFNEIFNRTRKITRIYSSFERMLLDRLKRNKKYSEDEGRYFFIINTESKIDKVKILGYYSYFDVDGTVSGKIAEKENGEIVNVNWQILYVKHPHDWVFYLSNSDKIQYANFIKYTHDDALIIEKFYKKLPLDVKREIILNKVLR